MNMRSKSGCATAAMGKPRRKRVERSQGQTDQTLIRMPPLHPDFSYPSSGKSLSRSRLLGGAQRNAAPLSIELIESKFESSPLER